MENLTGSEEEQPQSAAVLNVVHTKLYGRLQTVIYRDGGFPQPKSFPFSIAVACSHL